MKIPPKILRELQIHLIIFEIQLSMNISETRQDFLSMDSTNQYKIELMRPDWPREDHLWKRNGLLKKSRSADEALGLPMRIFRFKTCNSMRIIRAFDTGSS